MSEHKNGFAPVGDAIAKVVEKAAEKAPQPKLTGKGTPRTSKRGRPSDYTEEIANKVIDLIVTGVPLHKIATMPGIPAVPTIIRWTKQFPDFAEAYNNAFRWRAEMFADQIIALADDKKISNEMCERQTNARKWHVSRQLPKKYWEVQTPETIAASNGDNAVLINAPSDSRVIEHEPAYAKLLGFQRSN